MYPRLSLIEGFLLGGKFGFLLSWVKQLPMMPEETGRMGTFEVRSCITTRNPRFRRTEVWDRDGGGGASTLASVTSLQPA